MIPDQKVLEEAVSHIDYKNIQVDGTTVTMKDPKCRIDLGGIAKGYIADRLKEYLEKEGIEHATINLGQNLMDRIIRSGFRNRLQRTEKFWKSFQCMIGLWYPQGIMNDTLRKTV